MALRRYDVCLSFAGEDRPYVDQVARQLRRQNIRVFYDMYEEIDLWGKDLYVHLDMVYRLKARYCVPFLSSNYASKLWTTHELRSAQARALLENREYILPVRFDNTTFPDSLDGVAYIDLSTKDPLTLASMIAEKIGCQRRAGGRNWGAPPVRVCGCDLDGTIIRGDFRYSWQLVWQHLRYDDSLRRSLFRRFRHGEFTYERWCQECLTYFQARQLKEQDFDVICAALRPTKNLAAGLQMLRREGIRVGIVSGGISTVLEKVLPDHQELFDFCHLNVFSYDTAGFLESIIPTLYDFNGKLAGLEHEATQVHGSLDEAAFIGEGANDAHVMSELNTRYGGLSIAYPGNDLEVDLGATTSIDDDDFVKVAETILVRNNGSRE